MKILLALFRFIKYIFTDFVKDYYTESIKPEIDSDPIATSTPINEVPTPIQPTNQERLYQTAKDCSMPSHDVSPDDIAPDEVGCCESLDNIYKLTFGMFINGTKNKPTLSTILVDKILSANPSWQRVYSPEPGIVAIAVTGTGNGNLSNGHIAICGYYGLMSNNSYNGNWEQNYTYAKWKERYEKLGGFKTKYYKKL